MANQNITYLVAIAFCTIVLLGSFIAPLIDEYGTQTTISYDEITFTNSENKNYIYVTNDYSGEYVFTTESPVTTNSATSVLTNFIRQFAISNGTYSDKISCSFSTLSTQHYMFINFRGINHPLEVTDFLNDLTNTFYFTLYGNGDISFGFYQDQSKQIHLTDFSPDFKTKYIVYIYGCPMDFTFIQAIVDSNCANYYVYAPIYMWEKDAPNYQYVLWQNGNPTTWDNVKSMATPQKVVEVDGENIIRINSNIYICDAPAKLTYYEKNVVVEEGLLPQPILYAIPIMIIVSLIIGIVALFYSKIE